MRLEGGLVGSVFLSSVLVVELHGPFKLSTLPCTEWESKFVGNPFLFSFGVYFCDFVVILTDLPP